MREIKFRAWDNKENKMIYSHNDIWSWFSDNYMDDFSSKNDERIIMQYTGIKDKNGKEIYENDILKNQQTKEISIIKWDQPTCSFIGFPHGEQEIIGNIFENHDLLKNADL